MPDPIQRAIWQKITKPFIGATILDAVMGLGVWHATGSILFGALISIAGWTMFFIAVVATGALFALADKITAIRQITEDLNDET
jgi:uncharacterized membrane protein